MHHPKSNPENWLLFPKMIEKLNAHNLLCVRPDQPKESLELREIDWILRGPQDDCASAIFYALGKNDTNANQLLMNRLQETQVGVMIFDQIPACADLLMAMEINYLVVTKECFLAAQKLLLDHFYPINWSTKKVVAVTGTNGKTTTTFLAQQIARQKGIQACCLGTLGVGIDQTFTTGADQLTTPPLIETTKTLYHYFERDGFECCFMEVSSHALKQQRVYGFKFAHIGWTNFTQDHLDYHGSMEDYFLSKLAIHEYRDSAARAIPIWCAASETELAQRICSHGVPAQTTATLEQLRPEQEKTLPAFLRVSFNRANLALALTLCQQLYNIDPRSVEVERLVVAKGRFEQVTLGKQLVIIDFAHTPDALDRICQNIKELYPTRKLTVLFGCGGNRDRTKRPLMGQVVAQWADKIIITSDNPRFESPEEIIADILKGIPAHHPEMSTQVNRETATFQALEEMVENEVLLIAGKGHEEYQIIDGNKQHYSDVEVVERFKNGRA